MRLPQDKILHIDTEFKDGKVDVVAEWQGELVRCKDCRHFTHYADGCGVCTEKANILTYQNQNDFCSYGERKGGDDE